MSTPEELASLVREVYTLVGEPTVTVYVGTGYTPQEICVECERPRTDAGIDHAPDCIYGRLRAASAV